MNDLQKVYWTASIFILAFIAAVFIVLGVIAKEHGAAVWWSAFLGAVLLFLFLILYASIYLYLQYKDDKK